MEKALEIQGYLHSVYVVEMIIVLQDCVIEQYLVHCSEVDLGYLDCMSVGKELDV